MFKKILAGGLSLIFAVSAMSFIPFAEEKQLAFPGAEGGGMYSQGARASSNFNVYHVTNLYDSGSGSFRDAVSQGNRIIVFDVAGNIMLESSLQIRSSNLTILGQTAPGEGICVGGNDVRFSNANNIIMRYMRFRMGDISDSQEDGLGVRNCTEVILDHCSVSWSIDECLSAYENKNFTAQYCIISESLNQSHHAKGDHGYGGIWGGTNASFHHNLIATHNSRTPRIGSNATVHSYQDRPDYESLVDVRNNVIYNWGNQCAYGGELNTRINFVNNYYKPTATANPDAKFLFDIYCSGYNSKEGSTLHVSGNVMEDDTAVTNNNWLGVAVHQKDIVWTKCESISDGYTDENGKLWANDQYIYDYPVTTTDANTAYEDVLDKAGASFRRDSIDDRVVNDVRNGTVPTGSKSGKGLIDSQEDVGGWIELYGVKENDNDNDGMDDDWERAKGLDQTIDDSKNIAENGYTNIENYANDIIANARSNTDKTALKSEIDRAKVLNENDYSSEDWQKLQAELKEAEITYYRSSATQEEIDKVCSSLKALLDSLVVDHSDYLRRTVEKAKGIDIYLYTSESVDKLNIAVERAETDLEEGNSENYENDVTAIEEAISALVNNESKTLLKKLMDFVSSMDLSNITYSSRQGISSQLEEANKVYKNFSATEEEVNNAKQIVYDIVAKGRYDVLRQGKILDKIDFEDGKTDMFGIEGYGTGNAEIKLAEGYGDNTTKVATTDFSNGLYGVSYFDTIKSDHFRVSCDMAGNRMYYLLGLYDMEKTRYTITHPNAQWYMVEGYEQNALDVDFNGFFETREWFNVSIEYNKPANEVIYYINDLPVYRNKHDIENVNNLKIYLEPGTYVDNIIITDLSGSAYFEIGDANIDGNVNSTDVSLLLKRVLTGEKTPIEYNIDTAMDYMDLDCSGTLNSADVAMLLQKVLDSAYIVPADGLFTTTETTTELVSETTTQAKTETTTQTVSETSTETTTEESTETTTSNIVQYPVEGGYIEFDRTTGYITGHSSRITDVVIPESIEGVPVVGIGKNGLANCRYLAKAYIPSTLKEIGPYAFSGSSIADVTIEYGVEKLERYAFSGSLLTEVTIPGSISVIGEKAFSACRMLENVVIEEGVSEIENDAFSEDYSLSTITIPDSVISIGSLMNFKATILCHEGSYAQQYAIDNNYKYEIIQ